MKWRDLRTWRPAVRNIAQRVPEPLVRLQDEVNKVFENVLQPVEHWFGSNRFVPRVNVYEGKESIKITAELPGCKAEDFEVTLLDDSLVIRGEKKEHHEEEQQGVRYVESTFGSFERVIPLTAEINRAGIEPHFKNGMLEVVLYKTEPSDKGGQKLEIKSS
jgi:HSP20 family protein